ncbi:AraC family transcriptional regulator [Paenibacillus xylaniclasticus]|uniref:AraC family transcriptional regulator n=1 Tax=Paenibacillus xylaniclasticus TaxID=588083 RepID=UPI000FD9BEA9|nr:MULTISPECIES: AraC family transcriptional regulator [Paenibacillus]GFN29985.1 AraC family transcriptional regulator [Paenibacillus curdlanolyticus]
MPQPQQDTRHEHEFMMFQLNPLPGEGELDVLFAGEGKPHPLHKIGPAVHEYVLIHTVLSGSGTYTMKGRTYTCRAGDSFIIFPGELFSYQADAYDPWHYLWVSFTGARAQILLETVGITPDKPIAAGARLTDIRSLHNSLMSSLSKTDEPHIANLESSGWLRLMLSSLGQASRAERSGPVDAAAIDRQIEQAIRFMSLHYAQPVSIEQLSWTLGYHRTHLSRMFKRMTGLSPKQYLMQIRLERAQQLLTETAMPIDQVAASAGFNDPLYFSKKFRSWAGISPSAYRQAAVSRNQ